MKGTDFSANKIKPKQNPSAESGKSFRRKSPRPLVWMLEGFLDARSDFSTKNNIYFVYHIQNPELVYSPAG